MRKLVVARVINSRMHIAWYIFLAILSWAILPHLSWANHPNLDSLLTSSVGGEQAVRNIRTLNTFRMSGRIDIAGQIVGTFVSTVKYPDKFRYDVTYGTATRSYGYDGANAWMTEFNGVPEKLMGSDRAKLLSEFYFASFGLLRNLSGANSDLPRYDGMDTLHSIPYHRIADRPDWSTDTMIHYLTVDGSMPYMLTRKHGSNRSLRYVSDQLIVDSVPFPLTYVDVSNETEMGAVYFVDTIAIDEPLSDTIFQQPERRFSILAFPEGQDSVTMPIKYSRGRVIIPVSVNGTKRRYFQLDTGAPTCTITPSFAEKLGLPISMEIPPVELRKGIGLKIAAIDSLDLGEVKLRNGQFPIIGFGHLSRWMSSKFVGYLGHDFLSTGVMRLDIRGRVLTVYAPGVLPEMPSDKFGHTFILDERKPVIHAEVNGISGQFLFDLGSGVKVIVSREFAEQNGIFNMLLPNVLSAERNQFIGIGTIFDILRGRADSIRMSSVLQKNVRVSVIEPYLLGTNLGRWDGILGAPFLENFIVYFDYPNNRIYLVPHEKEKSRK